MVYYDCWDKDPKNLDELWSRLNESFMYIEGDLCSPVETLEEALSDNRVKEHWYGSIRYRDTDDRDNLIYFLERGQKLLPEVSALLKKKEFGYSLFIKWSDLNFCHGFVSNSMFCGGDDLDSKRGGINSAGARRKDKHRILISRLILPLLDEGKSRKEAERLVVQKINMAIDAKKALKPLFARQLPDLLSEDRKVLKSTYSQRKLTVATMRHLVDERKNLPLKCCG